MTDPFRMRNLVREWVAQRERRVLVGNKEREAISAIYDADVGPMPNKRLRPLLKRIIARASLAP